MSGERFKARFGLVAAIAVMAGCMSLVVAGEFYRGDPAAALPGAIAPDFTVRDINNKPVSLSELRGNIVVVYFTQADSSGAPTPESVQEVAATPSTQPDAQVLSLNVDSQPTAGPQQAQRSEISALRQKLGSDLNIKVLALRDQPLSQTDAEQKNGAVDAAGSPVQTLIDPTGDVAREYRVDKINAMPTFFVIDCKGVIRYRGTFEHGTNLPERAKPAGTSDQARISSNPLTSSIESSSCPQALQNLLSAQAVSSATPASSHF